MGLSGSIKAETEALLQTCDVDYDHDGEFDSTVLDEVSAYERWGITDEEVCTPYSWTP
jgi:hypothetical protein